MVQSTWPNPKRRVVAARHGGKSYVTGGRPFEVKHSWEKK